MSVRIMGMIWDLPIAADEKLVLLAYADHADHNGESIFPAVNTIKRKTSYSERSVQYITRRLVRMGLLVPDGSDKSGTNKWRIPLDEGGANIAPLQTLHRGVQPIAPGGCNPRHKGVQPIAPEPSLTIIKPSVKEQISSHSSSKKRPTPEGLPEPTGDAFGDWLELGRRVEEKDKPIVAVIEALAAWPYNFPHFGESKSLDRVIRQIAADGRDVKQFISWAKANKRDPHWYQVKPDTLWGDWPQAFDVRETLSPVEIAYQEIEKERSNGSTLRD